MHSILSLLSLLATLSTALPAPHLPSGSIQRTPEGSRLSKHQTNPIDEILALISQLFPLNILVTQVGDLITVAETAVADVLDYATTENALLDGDDCGDVLTIFARGTTEPGNVGSLVGPPFFAALSKQLAASGQTLVVQGVDQYTASVTGFLQGGDAQGSSRMADLVTRATTQCPSSQLVMAGYSQGGQLVHNAAKQLPASTVAQISSFVIFGDPDDGYPIQNADTAKVLTVCHVGDNICDHGDLVLLPHLTYAMNAEAAAAFVVVKAQVVD